MKLDRLSKWLLLSPFGKSAKALWRVAIPPLVFSRELFGLHLFFLYSSRDLLENGDGFSTVIKGLPANSKVFDVGCNVGIYSLLAAKLGHDVTAFDLSPLAIALLNKSAQENNLKVSTVARALTVERTVYVVPKTAYAGNQVTQDGNQARLSTSMDWRSAVEQFDIPNLIKMDIEGAEIDFLRNDEFRSWLEANQITLLVETHSEDSRHALLNFKSGVAQLSENNFAVAPKLENAFTKAAVAVPEPSPSAPVSFP